MISSTIIRAGVAALLAATCATLYAQGLTAEDNVHSPQNGLRVMPNAPTGSEYPTHGNRQAGEMPLNPTDPRAQLANGLPNNAQSGGYGSPLAGVKSRAPAAPALGN